MIVKNTIRKTFAPLLITRHYEVIGSALTQVFKSTEVVYEPNRAITPTIIIPMISVTDPDRIYPTGVANKVIGDIKWYVNGVDVTTTTDYSNGLYSIDKTDTASRGCLTVKKNVPSELPLLLMFKAKLLDTRRNILIDIIIADILLISQTVSTDKFTVELDKPVEYIFNPLSAASNNVVFTAKAFRGEDLILNNATGVTFSLLKKIGAAFVVCTSTNCPELISGAVGAYTLDMRLIGKEDYQISMFKDAIEVASVQFSIVRQYPVFDLEMMSFGDVLPRQAVIPARAVIQTRGDVIVSPGLYFSIVWHTVTTTKGDITHNMGEMAEIPSDKTGIDASNCEIYCEVFEKPAMKIVANSTGVAYGNSTGVTYICN